MARVTGAQGRMTLTDATVCIHDSHALEELLHLLDANTPVVMRATHSLGAILRLLYTRHWGDHAPVAGACDRQGQRLQQMFQH